jgi:glycine/serine hydroxymethyltransferase
MGVAEMSTIASVIGRVIAAPDDEASLAAVKADVRTLADRFPLYPQ